MYLQIIFMAIYIYVIDFHLRFFSFLNTSAEKQGSIFEIILHKNYIWGEIFVLLLLNARQSTVLFHVNYEKQLTDACDGEYDIIICSVESIIQLRHLK